MNILLFGATGIVGQGVLRECLLDPAVVLVQIVGRTATGVQHPETSRSVAPGLVAAETLSRLNPQMTLIYVSGVATDGSERGRTMWARVKGKAENAPLRLPFKAAYMFRPDVIQPLHGVRSNTAAYRVLYFLTKPLLPWLRRALPDYITTTEQMGLAMLAVARHGAEKRILEGKDITAIVLICYCSGCNLPPCTSVLPFTSTVVSGKKNQRTNPPRTAPPSS